MSNGESPTYAQSAGSTPRRSAASSSGSGSGLCRSVSSPPTTVSNRWPSGTRANASSAVARRFAVTIPSRRPSSLSCTSTSSMPAQLASSSWSGSLCARYTETSSSTCSGANARICASSPGPPTAAISSASGGAAPRTCSAACGIDTRMIAAESTTVPSRSKRTTGKRTISILATAFARLFPALRRRFGAGRVVAHADEVEAPRRRRLAGGVPPRAVEERSDVDAVDHRSDERSHHVTQERVRGHLEREHVALVHPPRSPDDADEDLVVRPRRREGAKVMLADQLLRSSLQHSEIERPRQPPRAAMLERGTDVWPPDPVPVRPRASGEARVEPGPCFARVGDGYVGGQRSVQRLGDTRSGRAALDVDARDVRERVHAGVRASRDGERFPAREDLVELVPHASFDGAHPRLRRPAAKRGAVVLDRQLQAHVRAP